MFTKNPLCALVITVIVLVILLWLVLGASRENFNKSRSNYSPSFSYKTPYPAQCPPQGYALEAPTPTAPYVRSDEQVQLQPSRCSGNGNPSFYTQVYNRNTSPMDQERRSVIREMTGVTMKGPEDHMVESFQYQTGNYGDIILDSSIGMYPKNVMDVCTYDYDYPYSHNEVDR